MTNNIEIIKKADEITETFVNGTDEEVHAALSAFEGDDWVMLSMCTPLACLTPADGYYRNQIRDIVLAKLLRASWYFKYLHIKTPYQLR